MKFLENILKNLLSWPGGEPIGLNSSVWLLDKDIKYLPIISQVFHGNSDIFHTSLKYTTIWLSFILIIFLVPFLKNKKNILKEKWYAFLFGYVIGIIIIVIQTILPRMNNYLAIIKDPQAELKLMNIPIVDEYKSSNSNLKEYIKTTNMGDYKILLENNILPKSDKYGYLITAKTYLEYEKENKLKGINLDKYLNDSCADCKGYNPDTHEQAVTFNDRLEIINSLSFYLGTLILTFGLYISDIHRTNLIKNGKILFILICLVILITLTTNILGYSVPGNQNITNYGLLIGYKHELLILAISFALTAILIV